MSKSMSITFRIGEEDCGTIILNSFNPHDTYQDDLISYTDYPIIIGSHHLPVGISMTWPKKVVESLNLPISNRAKKQYGYNSKE